MKKVLHNKNGLRAVGAVLFVCFMTVVSFGQANGDYRSKNTSGTWATATDWEIYNSGTMTWSTSGTAPTGSTAVEIISNHSMSIAVALTLTNPVTVNGTVTNNSGSAITLSGSGRFTFGSGGMWVNVGNFAMPSAANFTFNTGSTIKITGITSTGSNLNLSNYSFYHLIWECTGQTTNYNFTSTAITTYTIGGDLTVNSTGSGTSQLRLLSYTNPSNNVTKTFNVSGNVFLNGGIVAASGSSTGVTSCIADVNITSNLEVVGGNLKASASSVIIGNWNIGKDFKLSGGIVEIGSATGSVYNFTGTGSHTFTRTNGTDGTLTSAPFSLISTGTLTLEPASIFNGGGSFTVNSGTTLVCGHASGILGNIQTSGTKTFSSSANYTFNAAGSQSTSAFVTSPTANTVNNLTINNAAGVTLTNPLTVNGALTLTSGSLNLNSQTLTMGSSSMLKGTGTIIGNYSHPSGSTLAPGASPGTVSITGNLTNTGDWAIELGGATAGTQYDQVLATGAATLTSGTVNVTLINGYVPALGATFVILDAASLTGTFTNINLPTLGGGKVWLAPVYDMAAGTVTLMVDIALGVDLTLFKVKSNNQTNLLTWTTATEKNNSHFNIERSTNGVNFTSIGTMKGNGTTTTANNYSFADETPLSINYYRLQSVDFDGKTQASNIVSVFRSTSGKLKVYPTVASDKLNILTDNNDAQTFSISDLMGRTVQTGQLNGQKELSISTLAVGTYVLKVGGDVVKFVKQ